MRPLAQSDLHDAPRLLDELVPCLYLAATRKRREYSREICSDLGKPRQQWSANTLTIQQPHNLFGRDAAIASIPTRAICAEIGVWQGDFSQRIIELGLPIELHLIDPWAFAPEFPGRWYGGKKAANQTDMDRIFSSVANRFASHSEVHIRRLPSIVAAEIFAPRYFDWIYIDGNHSYDEVLSDLNAWYPKMNSGGQIWLDDYNWRDESDRYSVRDAITEFLKCMPELSGSESAGQFSIRIAP